MTISAHSIATLLAKDLRLQWSALLVLLVFEALTFVAFQAQFPPQMRLSAGVFLQGVASIGTFVMAYRSIAAEESNKTIRFLKSLPLTNDEIYGTKFLFMALSVVANLVILDVGYMVARPLVSWEMGELTAQAAIIGLVVQLAFAGILVSVAVLASSEKAIWVPFPAVIVLLNAYTLVTGDDGPLAGTSVLESLLGNWEWYTAAVAALVAALVVVVLRRVRHKTSLAG